MKKKLLVPLALLFCISFHSIAQNQHQTEKQEQRLKWIISELSLDENQAAKFTVLYQNRMEELRVQSANAQENQQATNTKNAELKLERKESRDNYRAQLKEILSDEQIKQLNKMIQEKNEGKKLHPRKRGIKMDGELPGHRLMKDQTEEKTEGTKN